MHRFIQTLRALVFAALCGLTTSVSHAMLEGTFLYFPTHEPNQSTLSEWKIYNRLIGYARTVESPAEIWLVCHGNGGQASGRQYIVNYLPRDACVYILEYPGYGQRPGKPSMKSINAAAVEAYSELRQLYPQLLVRVLGESLGSGAASFLCAQPTPPDSLVLMVPFDTLLSVGKEQIKFLPVTLLMRDKWNNLKTLSHYRGPVEIFGAKNDTVIPVHHAQNLANKIPQAIYTELTCQHNEWSVVLQPRRSGE